MSSRPDLPPAFASASAGLADGSHGIGTSIGSPTHEANHSQPHQQRFFSNFLPQSLTNMFANGGFSFSSATASEGGSASASSFGSQGISTSFAKSDGLPVKATSMTNRPSMESHSFVQANGTNVDAKAFVSSGANHDGAEYHGDYGGMGTNNGGGFTL